MILRSEINKSKAASYKLQVAGYRAKKPATWNLKPVTLIVLFLLPIALLFAGCYSFKDIGSIPPDVKTFKVLYIENRARYVNPQLSPQLTDGLKQKIVNQTRLSGVKADDEAHYEIGGTITGYNVTTSGVSTNTTSNTQQASLQRLTVTVHVVFKNTLDATKSFEADVSRNFDYGATLSLTEAEAQLTSTIIKNMVDEIFNRIFSNW